MKRYYPQWMRAVCPECGSPSQRHSYIWQCEKCKLAWEVKENSKSDMYRIAYRRSSGQWCEVPKNTMMVWQERQEV